MLSTLKSGPNMRLRFRVKTGTNPSSGTSTLIASSGNLHVDKWIFATAVYNGTHMILYKDGIKVGKTAKTGTLATSSSVEAWIGDNPSAGGKEFDGRIDEVAIFDRALSPDEVADLYYDTRFGIYNYLPDIHDRPSINLYHDGDASELIVWGGAPAMANNATIYIYELDGTEYHSQTETVGMQGEHAKAYRAEVDISSWDPEKYNVVVKFYNSTDGYMDGYDVGDLFDDLLLWDLEMRMDEAEYNISLILDAVYDNSEDLAGLQARSARLTNAVIDLRARVDRLEGAMGVVIGRLTYLESSVNFLGIWLTALTYRSQAMNHGTINMAYFGPDARPAISNRLRVWGEAPRGATSVMVVLLDSNGNIITPPSPVSATLLSFTGPNPGLYSAFIDTSDLEPLKYNVRVMFYNGPAHMIGYDVGDLFDNLYMMDLAQKLDELEFRVDDLEIRMTDAEVNIVELWNNTNEQWTAIYKLRDRVRIIWGDVNSLKVRMSLAERRIDILFNRINRLENRVGLLEDVLYGFFVKQPIVFPLIEDICNGPLGVNQFNCEMRDVCGFLADEFDGTFLTDATAGQLRVLSALLGVDDTSKLNLAWDVCKQIAIDDLQERMDDVEYDLYGIDKNNFIQDARLAWCDWKQTREDYDTAWFRYCEAPNAQNNWKNKMEALGYDDMIFLTARNLYEDDARKWDAIYDIWDQLEELFDEVYYGFHDIVFTSRVETYFEPEAIVPITYTLRSENTIRRARIGVRDPSMGFRQVLRQQTIFADRTYRLTDYVRFSEIGTYNLQLALFSVGIACTADMDETSVECGPGVHVHESTRFVTDVVDLADFVPNSTIEIVLSDNWGNIHSTPPNPPAGDISWHQSGLIPMKAMLGANTPLTDSACDVYYYSNRYSDHVEADALGRLFLSGLTIHDEILPPPIDVFAAGAGETVKYCADDILSTMMDEGDEGVFRLEVEQEFIASFDQTDYIRIGIDDTPPVIHEIIPGEGAYSGVLLVKVDASDELSGVDTVWVTMIHKDTLDEYDIEAVFNATTGYFVAEYDTIDLDMEDGNYNISVLVTDIVGLTAFGMIDPIIDNTPPAVVGIDFPVEMCVGDTFTISVTIVDLMSGVCQANASLLLPEEEEDNHVDIFNGDEWINLVLSGGAGGVFTAQYTPETNLSGWYTLRVNASDCAISRNHVENITEHNVTVEAECPPEPVPGSSGGGSGGRTIITTTTETTATGGNPAMDLVGPPRPRAPAPEPTPEPAPEPPAPAPIVAAPAVIEEPVPEEPAFPWLAILLTSLGLILILVGIGLQLYKKHSGKKK